LNQLKNSGLTLSPLSLPVDTTAQSQRTIMPGHILLMLILHSVKCITILQRTTQVTFQPPLTLDL
jgi:hypothetical protein